MKPDRVSWMVLGLLFVICFLGIDRDLWTPDEPREAEISREMMISPRVVPTLNGEEFIEKPPLYYWTVAAAYQVTGGPSAAAARGVSALASFLTLLLVYFWGRRDFSRSVGLVAAVGLATSIQFMITSHWIVIDPLLMLFTTIAIWAGYDLVSGRERSRTLFVFYTSLVLALWTKGLIGPVLLAAGFLVYLAARRSISPLWLLRPFTGVAIMLLAIAGLMALIYLDAGYDSVREWFWVNHVQRFTDPVGTGHERPIYQYFEYLPLAIFPWWLPFVDLFKPSLWRDGKAPNHDLKLYLVTVCIGMFLILSLSSTKRGLYLMPMLPPLFLLLAGQAMAWWQRQPEGSLGGIAWWLQVGLVWLLGLGPTVLTLAYLRSLDPVAVFILLILTLMLLSVVIFSRRGDKPRAFVSLASCAVAGVLTILLVDFRLAASVKDMSPYMAQIEQRLPADRPVYVTGRIDETLRGIVPFALDREMMEVEVPELYEIRPQCVIVQDKNGGRTAPQIESPYQLEHDRKFGPGRYLAFWCQAGKS